jgi:hypothetical protein
MLFCDRADRSKLTTSGVSKEHVNRSRFVLHDRKKPIEIREIAYVAHDATNTAAHVFDRVVQLPLATAANKQSSSFASEELRGGKAYTSRRSSDNSDLPIELAHRQTPS